MLAAGQKKNHNSYDVKPHARLRHTLAKRLKDKKQISWKIDKSM